MGGAQPGTKAGKDETMTGRTDSYQRGRHSCWGRETHEPSGAELSLAGDVRVSQVTRGSHGALGKGRGRRTSRDKK